MSVGTRFEVIFGAAGAGKNDFLAPQAPEIGFWGWFSSDFLKENAPESAGKSFAFERIYRF